MCDVLSLICNSRPELLCSLSRPRLIHGTPSSSLHHHPARCCSSRKSIAVRAGPPALASQPLGRSSLSCLHTVLREQFYLLYFADQPRCLNTTYQQTRERVRGRDIAALLSGTAAVSLVFPEVIQVILPAD